MQFNQGKKGSMSEINVTPLVDVMLVLLVIFMVTAPMLYSGIELKLPKTQKVNTLGLKPELVVLNVTGTEEYFLGKEGVTKKDLVPSILNEMKQKNVDVIYLRADYGLKYEKVAQLIASLKRAGISNIALVTEVESNK
ncbi:MAG TPA: biopolymer transporter ExbD [Bacteriovoracaceae bacterium]|nr:biopolymer transporter ExbD [Bacteriovoracaceae bacterium]